MLPTCRADLPRYGMTAVHLHGCASGTGRSGLAAEPHGRKAGTNAGGSGLTDGDGPGPAKDRDAHGATRKAAGRGNLRAAPPQAGVRRYIEFCKVLEP